MKSLLIYESFVIGLKEGFKLGIVWLVFYSYLIRIDRRPLIKPFYIGVLSALLLSSVFIVLPQVTFLRDILGKIISISFAVIFILSTASLFHVSDRRLFGVFYGLFKNNTLVNVTILLATVLFFAPDSMGSWLFLRELSVMKETEMIIYLNGLTGFLISVVMFFIIFRYCKPYWIGRFFDVPQLILFLGIVKLLGSGIKGFTELSLIPSVQRGFMKFTHDFVHQTFVFLMVPDHLLLKTTVWNFIGFFFGSNFASVASLIILLFSPLLFIYYSLFRPVQEPEAGTGAEKRRKKAMIISDRRKKAIPVIIFICLILLAWFSKGGEEILKLYNPKPRPVVVEEGMVVIPMNDPAMNLLDGRLHKFSLMHEGEEIRIIIMKKPDNVLTVCLDACEICPPVGYGQIKDHVICIYCNTPISIDTLGVPGGCNPIPLSASVDGRFVKVEIREILKKWEYVKTGESKEAIK